jgi:DNA-binding transcriptional MerR regulator
MRIGELARRAGVTTKAVRYYESAGLLDAPRLTNGYRDFTERDVEVVAQIRDLVALGVRVDDARPFVECLVAGNAHGDDCPASLDAYVQALRDLDARIGDLHRRRTALLTLIARAGGCADCANADIATDETLCSA